MGSHQDYTPDQSHALRPTKRGLVLYCNNKRIGLLQWADLDYMRENKQSWQVMTIPLGEELGRMKVEKLDATATANADLPPDHVMITVPV